MNFVDIEAFGAKKKLLSARKIPSFSPRAGAETEARKKSAADESHTEHVVARVIPKDHVVGARGRWPLVVQRDPRPPPSRQPQAPLSASDSAHHSVAEADPIILPPPLK